MYVAHLSLADFRSYADVELGLDAGVTAFIGPNGQGKTNLVEAVGYLSTLGSHRVAHDTPLIRAGAERAIVRAQVVGGTEGSSRPTLIEVEITPGKANRARINRSPARRPRDVLGILRTVLFAPEDLALVKGDPAGRRRFLDDLLVAQAPRYAAVRSDYDRVLKQRNALLKTAGQAMRAGRGATTSQDLPTLDVWDSHLATSGAELLVARIELVDALRPLVAKAYEAVATVDASTVNHVQTELSYQSSVGDDIGLIPDQAAMSEALLEAVRARRRDEIDRGVSLVGPHRDDLVLRLGTLPAKGYASQGESWSYALALRLASFDLLRASGSDPVLILDDVFSELDANRRTRLAELVSDAEQVLVTAAVPHDVPESLTGARVEVAGGSASPAGP